MSRNEQLSNIYRSFCEAEGSKHIASEYAIKKLQKLLSIFKVKNTLEVGLGIGSVSGILLSLNKNLNYSGVESNEYCLNALVKNLKTEYRRLKVYDSLYELSRERKFDLIVIDGNDSDLAFIKDLVAENGIIAIEGDRLPQVELLKEIFPQNKYVHCISLKKNKEYSPFSTENWQGGLKIIFINPTIKQALWWLKEKYFTKIKYQYPGRYFGEKKENRKRRDS